MRRKSRLPAHSLCLALFASVLFSSLCPSLLHSVRDALAALRSHLALAFGPSLCCTRASLWTAPSPCCAFRLQSFCEQCSRFLQFDDLSVDFGDNAANLHLGLLKDGNRCKERGDRISGSHLLLYALLGNDTGCISDAANGKRLLACDFALALLGRRCRLWANRISRTRFIHLFVVSIAQSTPMA